MTQYYHKSTMVKRGGGYELKRGKQNSNITENNCVYVQIIL